MNEEEKAERIYRLISDYAVEYRGGEIASLMLGFSALAVALIAFANSIEPSRTPIYTLQDASLLFNVSTLYLLIILFRMLFFGLRRRKINEVARMLVIASGGKRVALYRAKDFCRISAARGTPERSRSGWLVYELEADGRIGSRICDLRLTALQAFSVERILNDSPKYADYKIAT